MSRYSSDTSGNSCYYELFALTVHIGSLEFGHYIAYTLRDGKWYLFNDEEVR